MQMKIVVETEEEYELWIKEQKEYLVKEEAEEAPMEQASEETEAGEGNTELITASL